MASASRSGAVDRAGPIATLRRMITRLASLTDALADASDALNQLEARCCEPGRSPRIAALRAKLEQVRELLTAAPADGAGADATFELLEQAGAMVGALQIGCCAPNRLPLYARVLERLTAIQIELNRSPA